MKFFLLFIVSLHICVRATVVEEKNESNLKSLSDFRNFKTCLGNFGFHNDTIIRTEDSRAMGAKYISESDVSSREDCLQLCCLTFSCDVFVYEEESSGSCYLFNCGSPDDDFKCKFTKHHNYTSGVLRLVHMGMVPEHVKMTKHEEELNKLRRPDRVTIRIQNNTLQAPQVAMPQETIHNVSKSENHSGARERARECKRFQFKCHSTDECIAIYNACDGIAQCSDASDESAELGCKAPVTSSAPPIVVSSVSVNDQEDLAKPQEMPYSLRLEKPTKLMNEMQQIQSERTMMNGLDNSFRERLQEQNQLPVPMKTVKPPDSDPVPSDFKVHHHSGFKKLEDSLEAKVPLEVSGVRQYLNPPGKQESEKKEEQNHYLAAQLMEAHNRDMEEQEYNRRYQDMNLQNLHMKSNSQQEQHKLVPPRKPSEQMPLYQNAERDPKLRRPMPPEEFNQQEKLENSLHHFTNTHMSDIQSELYQHEHSINKETHSPARNKIHNMRLMNSGMGQQSLNSDEIRGQNEQQVKEPNDREDHIEVKEKLQFREPIMQELSDRYYKYDDDDRRIFNANKEYGLMTDSESSENSYNLGASEVQYKMNVANDFANNLAEYKNQIQRNMWADPIHPTPRVMKVQKNTPKPLDTLGRYHLPNDYSHDEEQRSGLISDLPYHQHSSHHLPPPPPPSIRMKGSLARPIQELQQDDYQGYGDPSHQPDSKLTLFFNTKSRPKEPSISYSDDNVDHDKQKYTTSQPKAVSYTSEPIKPKNEVDDPKLIASLQHAYISEIPNDPSQEEPSGALLSMSFGLCITIVMIVLVACRLRIVKRRFQRNGKSLYAHDADYLVNGMYL